MQKGSVLLKVVSFQRKLVWLIQSVPEDTTA